MAKIISGFIVCSSVVGLTTYCGDFWKSATTKVVGRVAVKFDKELDQVADKLLDKGGKLVEKETKHVFGLDKKKKNPYEIHEASSAGADDRVLDLLKSGIKVDSTRPDGITPLMEASKTGQIAVISLLIAYRASVNLQESHGKTALYFAAEKGFEDAVELLVEDGHARVDIKACNNMYPHEVASGSLRSYLYNLMPEQYKKAQEDRMARKRSVAGPGEGEKGAKRKCV